jgi:hypothetical protein
MTGKPMVDADVDALVKMVLLYFGDDPHAPASQSALGLPLGLQSQAVIDSDHHLLAEVGHTPPPIAACRGRTRRRLGRDR